MKRIFNACLAIVLALPVGSVRGAAASSQLPDSMRNAISAAVSNELAADGGPRPVPGAVVGVWVPGKGDFVKGFGYANLSPRTPMAIGDHFRIGSNTKTFVAT